MANQEYIDKLKSQLGLDKFANYSWEQLCELINPDKFYSQVRSSNELRSFMQALSFNFCVKHGCTPMPVVISADPNTDIAYTTKKDLSQGQSKVVVNKQFLEMFNYMSHHKNTYFPYFIYEIMLHESVHVWQIQAAYNTLMLSFMPSDMQIAVLDQKLNELKIMAVATRRISVKDGADVLGSAFMIEKVLHNAKRNSENPLWDYSNSPSEITARDHTSKTLNEIVRDYATPQFQTILGEYVKDSNHQSFTLLLDPRYNNYNFFEELKYCQLFEEISEIASPYDLLSTVVDYSLKRQGLPTYSDYLKKTDEELLVRELEKLGGLVGLILSPQKYESQVRKLTRDFDADCVKALTEMQQNYTALFPYTHELSKGYDKPNQFMLTDQAIFDDVREKLKTMQKNS